MSVPWLRPSSAVRKWLNPRALSGWHAPCFVPVVDSSAAIDFVQTEVLAVFLPDIAAGAEDRRATVVLRDSDGRIEMRSMDARQVMADRRLAKECVKRGAPIVDPVSREVVGYEMEEVGSHAAVR